MTVYKDTPSDLEHSKPYAKGGSPDLIEIPYKWNQAETKNR